MGGCQASYSSCGYRVPDDRASHCERLWSFVRDKWYEMLRTLWLPRSAVFQRNSVHTSKGAACSRVYVSGDVHGGWLRSVCSVFSDYPPCSWLCHARTPSDARTHTDAYTYAHAHAQIPAVTQHVYMEQGPVHSLRRYR